MAAKYMGAKMLKKQIEKEQAAKAAVRKKGTVHGNRNEFLDRDAQKFDLTQSSMMADGDFEDKIEDEVEKDPVFDRTYEQLRRREENFLTHNENLIHGNDVSDSEDEATIMQEMLNRANNETQTLFKGVNSSVSHS